MKKSSSLNILVLTTNKENKKDFKALISATITNKTKTALPQELLVAINNCLDKRTTINSNTENIIIT